MRISCGVMLLMWRKVYVVCVWCEMFFHTFTIKLCVLSSLNDDDGQKRDKEMRNEGIGSRENVGKEACKPVKYRKCLHLVKRRKEGRWDELVIPLTRSFYILFSTGRGMRKWTTEMWIFDSVMKGERRQEMIWKGLPSKRGERCQLEISLPSHLSTRLSINYFIPWLVITHHPSKEKIHPISDTNKTLIHFLSLFHL